MSDAAEPVAIRVVDSHDQRLVVAAREMGDRFRRTLGLLAYPVYDEAAADGRLLAALAGDDLVGYVLYRTPRSEVAITQLCVDDVWRRRGIADRLVASISDRHRDRLGIKVKCRTDYNLDSVWERLGFTRRGEVPGRSKHGHPLTVWWLDHGHPNLFSELETVYQIQVALDMNVLLDLGKGDDERSGANDSRVLVGDELAGSIDLVITPEIYTELDRVKDPIRAQAARAKALRYRVVPVNPEAVEDAERAVLREIDGMTGVAYGTSVQDQSDLRAVVQAGCAGADVFVTRDEKLLKVLAGPALTVLGIRVLYPVDVVLHLDELQQAAAYQPARLLGTAYEIAIAGQGAEREIAVLANTSAGESSHELVRIARSIVAEGGRWHIIRNAESQVVAAYSTAINDDRLEVGLMRVKDDPLALTLSRQLLFMFRRECRVRRCVEVRVIDPRVSRVVQSAADFEEFRRTPGGLSCLVVDVAASAGMVGDVATDVASRRSGARDLPALTPGMSAQAAARVEKQIWPAKLLDSLLPTYIVPIRANWSSELFGEPEGLFARRSELGISLEHVYYRSARPGVVVAPARILWFRTAIDGGPAGEVIGVSMLDDVVEGQPDALFKRFSHLGVYSLDDVRRAAADRGVAQALRFSMTEIFDTKISVRQLQGIADRYGSTLFLQSPHRVTTEVFSEIWRVAHPKTVGE